MQTTQKNIDIVIEKLYALAHMDGFPNTPGGVQLISKEITRFVHNERLKSAQYGEAEDGMVNDLDWLIGTIVREYEKFPPMRVIIVRYEQLFPLDNAKYFGERA